MLFVFRDWDLWGPLILCLMLGIMLSINVRLRPCSTIIFLSSEATSFQAPADQALGVFTSVIVIVALGSVVVTIQAKVESNINVCMAGILI